MGGVSRGMRGTGGRSILVRIPWTPRAARKSRIAARARRKQPYFAESADLALWGSPGAALAAPRRAARPSHRGHVCMRRFHGPGVEVRRDRVPGARPERRFDDERKRPTRAAGRARRPGRGGGGGGGVPSTSTPGASCEMHSKPTKDDGVNLSHTSRRRCDIQQQPLVQQSHAIFQHGVRGAGGGVPGAGGVPERAAACGERAPACDNARAARRVAKVCGRLSTQVMLLH